MGLITADIVQVYGEVDNCAVVCTLGLWFKPQSVYVFTDFLELWESYIHCLPKMCC